MFRPRAAALFVMAMLAGCSGGEDPPVTPPEPMPAVEAAVETAPRNPFGVEDVSDPGGPDVVAYAEFAPDRGEPTDDNAGSWSPAGTAAHDSIDGEWASRWKLGDEEWTEGTATIQSVGDQVFILYRDEAEYLIEARRRGNRLIGRYRNLESPDQAPWVGTIVSNERIDGNFPEGLWDFRRGGMPQS